MKMENIGLFSLFTVRVDKLFFFFWFPFIIEKNTNAIRKMINSLHQIETIFENQKPNVWLKMYDVDDWTEISGRKVSVDKTPT